MKFNLDIFMRIVVGLLLIATISTLIFTGFSVAFKILIAIMLIISLWYQIYKSKQ